jgi:predicted NAD-dependent protein-ADP-ribosyltransferase YbiA (DUF1768 family)
MENEDIESGLEEDYNNSSSSNSSSSNSSSSNSNSSNSSSSNSSSSNSRSSNSNSSSVESNEESPEEKPKEKEKEKEKQKARRRREVQPMNSAEFFKARAKNPNDYNFTVDGNLQVPAIESQPAKIIELPFYRPITFDEQTELEEKRQAEIRAIETSYDETLRLLREAIEEFYESGSISKVGEYQNELRKLDAQRTNLQRGNRWTNLISSLEIRDLDFTSFDKRKLPYVVVQYRSRTLKSAEEFIEMKDKLMERKNSEENDTSLNLGEDEEEDEEDEEFIFFNEPLQAQGFLSPDSMRTFRYHNVQYNSPIQAFHGERLKRIGNLEKTFDLLLKQVTAKGIRAVAKSKTGDLEDAREVWIDILKEYIRYNQDLKEPLRETGTATLAYASATDNKWGTGLAMGDPNIENRSQWTGQNILGEAWMVVRKSVDSIEEASMEGGGAIAVAKTQEDLQRRSGVLANMYKIRNH